MNPDVERIEQALVAARQAVSAFTPGRIASEKKAGGDPVTEADLLLDQILKEALLQEGEGWLSEETVDDRTRLDKERVWIVDPLDGTREFIEGIPEWCISVGLIENGRPVAGGICNPSADLLVLGCVGDGVTLNGQPAGLTEKTELEGASILVSRSEIRKGLWDGFEQAPFEIIPTGSIAYKLACAAAGLTDGTISLAPKNEWDVAAGWALVQAAGGTVQELSGNQRIFNQEKTLLGKLIAAKECLFDQFMALPEIQEHTRPQ